MRVSYPDDIQDFLTDAVDGEHEDYRGSANNVEFAESQGWYDPEEDETFNLQDVYLQDFPTDDFEPNEVADAYFFSSSRRHTRWPRDWSSDVCSSDLARQVSITVKN